MRFCPSLLRPDELFTDVVLEECAIDHQARTQVRRTQRLAKQSAPCSDKIAAARLIWC